MARRLLAVLIVLGLCGCLGGQTGDPESFTCPKAAASADWLDGLNRIQVAPESWQVPAALPLRLRAISQAAVGVAETRMDVELSLLSNAGATLFSEIDQVIVSNRECCDRCFGTHLSVQGPIQSPEFVFAESQVGSVLSAHGDLNAMVYAEGGAAPRASGTLIIRYRLGSDPEREQELRFTF